MAKNANISTGKSEGKTRWVREDLPRVKRAAHRGDRDAAYELGVRYLTGRSVDRDPACGFDWVRRSARQGQVHAQELLGYCLVKGVGTVPDGLSAVHWFQRAARQGSAVARYNLGCCYLVGIGMPRSRRAARIYFSSAADLGYEKGSRALAALEQDAPDTAA